MISQSDLHGITDRIGKQVYNLRVYLGEESSTVDDTPDDICESILKAADVIWVGQDTDAINDLCGPLNNLQYSMDFENIIRQKYSGFINRLNSHLLNGASVSYSGFSYFALNNSATRFSSEFCRALYLAGLSLLDDVHCYYDIADTLGTFTVSGSGTGTWAASTFAWPADPTAVYSVQPSAGINAVANGLIGAANIDVTAFAYSIDDSIIQLTGQIPLGSADGTEVQLTSNGGEYDNFIKSIISVSISGGTAADSFYLKFKPIRTIAL